MTSLINVFNEFYTKYISWKIRPRSSARGRVAMHKSFLQIHPRPGETGCAESQAKMPMNIMREVFYIFVQVYGVFQIAT